MSARFVGVSVFAFDAAKKAAHRINSFCVVAFLTAASGMPVSKVTSLLIIFRR